MAPHSSTPAWKIPWTEEPSGLQSMGSQRVRHSLVTEHPHNSNNINKIAAGQILMIIGYHVPINSVTGAWEPGGAK